MNNNSTIQAAPQTLLDLWGVLLTMGTVSVENISNHLINPSGKHYDNRQGSYYGEALNALGIVIKTNVANKNFYIIKNEYILFSGKERAKKLSVIIKNKNLVERIKSNTLKLGKETQERRLKDLNKFINFDYDKYNKDIEYKNLQRNPNEESDYKLQNENKDPQKGTFDAIKDKGATHRMMANSIINYAKKHNIQLKQEFLKADLTSFNDSRKTLSIIEIKSYEGVYLAIGQLLHYENRFKSTIYKDVNIKYKKIYVSNQNISEEKKDLLEKLQIKFVLLKNDSIKEIFEN